MPYADMTGFRSPGTPVDSMSMWGQQPQPLLDTSTFSGAYDTSTPVYATSPTAGSFQTAPASPTASNGGGLFSGFLDQYNPETGQKTGQGWGGAALGGASALFNAWMGMKQYGLAKAQLAEGKRQFQLNYDAQRQMTNTQLQDRQAARVASNPGAYQSVGDYMSQHQISAGG